MYPIVPTRGMPYGSRVRIPKTLEALFILLIALAGGLAPLFIKWTDRHLHTALALSTGIFLGAVFLHLLPSIANLSNDLGHLTETPGHEGHAHGGILLWCFVLVGVLAVYLIESILMSTGDAGNAHGHSHTAHGEADLNRHRTIGYAALAGLVIHGLTAGISLAAAGHNEGISSALFLAICAHKGFEAFSLATVFLLAEVPRARVAWIVGLFALVTPFGILLGSQLMHVLTEVGIGIAAALAAGTFLYVCLCELLPEVFHRRQDVGAKITLLAAGIVLMYLFGEVGV